MVRVILLFLCAFFNAYVIAEEVKVEVLLDHSTVSSTEPLLGSIVVSHLASIKVDPKSFSYQKKSLNAEFLRKVDFPGSSPAETLVIETFRFKLDPFPVGLHVLSPISVLVGGQSYSSVPVSFESKPLSQMPTPAVGVNGQDDPAKPSLKLERIFLPDGPLYPGQKATIGYRYSFKGDIELRKEEIPFLDKSIFKNLGEKNIDDRQEGPISIREITQKVEMLEPGTFEVPISTVSGYAYKDKGWGPKTYFEPLLESEVPAFKIEINNFPEEGKPPFFNGAIGPFDARAALDAPPVLERGDKFIFNLFFQGAGVHSTIRPINLMCQPGWAGFFSVGDLPPQEKTKGTETLFSYELKPLTQLVESVPPVYLAYFDPLTVSYKVISSPPIAIEVVPPKQAPLVEKNVRKVIVMQPELKAPEGLPPLIAYENRKGFKLPFGSSETLLLIPAAILLAWLRLFYKEREEKLRLQPPSLESQLYDLERAVSNPELFSTKAKKILFELFGSSEKDLPDAAKRFLFKLDETLWGKPKNPENQNHLYEELRLLCTATGKLK